MADIFVQYDNQRQGNSQHFMCLMADVFQLISQNVLLDKFEN